MICLYNMYKQSNYVTTGAGSHEATAVTWLVIDLTQAAKISNRLWTRDERLGLI